MMSIELPFSNSNNKPRIAAKPPITVTKQPINEIMPAPVVVLLLAFIFRSSKFFC